MCRIVFLCCLMALMSGCASSSGATATCTSLVSMGGGLLQFCQSADKLRVSESGVDPANGTEEVKIVDDPLVLASLEGDLRLHAAFSTSRRLIARACLVKGHGFVSISAADLKRILASRLSVPIVDRSSDVE